MAIYFTESSFREVVKFPVMPFSLRGLRKMSFKERIGYYLLTKAWMRYLPYEQYETLENILN